MPHIANMHSDNSVIAFNGRVSYCILMNYYQIIRCTSRVSCTTTPTGKNIYFGHIMVNFVTAVFLISIFNMGTWARLQVLLLLCRILTSADSSYDFDFVENTRQSSFSTGKKKKKKTQLHAHNVQYALQS